MNFKGMFTRCRPSILILAACLFALNATAQTLPPPIEWQRSYGGTSHDLLYDIKPTGDGGYLLAGTSMSGRSGNKTSPLRGSQDLFVVKIGADGKREWDRSVGKGWVNISSLVTTPDGGFVLGATAFTAGTAQTGNDPAGNRDYWLTKFDGLGRKQWDQTYGGTAPEWLRNVSRTADGGYLLSGASSSGISGNRTINNHTEDSSMFYDDYWIVKTDTLGRKQWERSHQRYIGDIVAAHPLPDGGYLSGNDNFWFVKVDSENKTEWRRPFAPTNSCYLHTFRPTPDGGFIAAGTVYRTTTPHYNPSRNGMEFLLLKVNANWEPEWNAMFGGDDGGFLQYLQFTSDGGYIVAGRSYGNYVHEGAQLVDGRVFKFDANGNQQWERTFTNCAYKALTSVRETKDGGYLLGLQSDSAPAGEKTARHFGGFDFWVVKLAKPTDP